MVGGRECGVVRSLGRGEEGKGLVEAGKEDYEQPLLFYQRKGSPCRARPVTECHNQHQ
jgi:hypothetical protein